MPIALGHRIRSFQSPTPICQQAVCNVFFKSTYFFSESCLAAPISSYTDPQQRARRHAFVPGLCNEILRWGGFYTDVMLDCSTPIYDNPMTGSVTCPAGFETREILDPEIGYIWQDLSGVTSCGQRIFQCVKEATDYEVPHDETEPDSHTHHQSEYEANYKGMSLQCCNVNENHHDPMYVCGNDPTTRYAQFRLLGNEHGLSSGADVGVSKDPCFLTVCWQHNEHGEFGGCYMRVYDNTYDVPNVETGTTSCPHGYVARPLTTALSQNATDCQGSDGDFYCGEEIYCCYRKESCLMGGSPGNLKKGSSSKC